MSVKTHIQAGQVDQVSMLFVQQEPPGQVAIARIQMSVVQRA